MKPTIKITIIYSVEPSYILGLLDGLSKIPDVYVNFLGSDRSITVRDKYKNIKFINIRGSQESNVGLINKIYRIILFYFKLLAYILEDNSQLYHLHFPNKFLFIDFVLTNILLKLKGKKIIYTAHNIDFDTRDKKQSLYKKIILNFHYRIVNHIIVHNKFSHRILVQRYPFTKTKITISRIGLNIVTRKTGLRKIQARRLLSIDINKKVLLFFGGINPYKGLETLIEAFSQLIIDDSDYLLIIAGAPRDKKYFKEIKSIIYKSELKDYGLFSFDFIPDEEVEKFFMASDCCILPYRAIFQSGLHVLSYSFGIPVIASNVGSFKEEDVIEGVTGYIFEANNPSDLKATILKFFNSSLYTNQEEARKYIKDWSFNTYSWDRIAAFTFEIYKRVLNVN